MRGLGQRGADHTEGSGDWYRKGPRRQNKSEPGGPRFGGSVVFEGEDTEFTLFQKHGIFVTSRTVL